MTRGLERPPLRFLVAGAVAGAAAFAVLVALAVLAATGRLLPVTDGLFDPGPLTRYGLPVARAVHDFAAALSVGLVVLAAWFVAPESRDDPDPLGGIRQRMVNLAASAVGIWLTAAAAVLVLTASEVSGLAVGSPGFGGLIVSFVTQIDLGRALGVSLLAVVATGCLVVAASRIATVAWAAVASLVALLPLALTGHSAGARDHMNAVDSLVLHLIGVTLWVGGLAGLLLIVRNLGPQLPTVVGRYSTLAGWCIVGVALSGVINAGLRLGSWTGLASPYGLLVVGKTAALILLGVAGFWHRRATIPRLAAKPLLFLRLAVVEVLIMGAAMGLAVALSRSVPPVPETPVDPASALLGQPAPAPLTLGRYVTAFYPELLWVTAVVIMVSLYVAGVVRLHRRGDRWARARLVFWLAGCVALLVITSGGPAVYGRMHFSTHMLQHMLLMIVVPMLLVFGAPVTLAMRALRARTDGSFGPRETLLRLVHSRVLRVLGHPAVAAVLFVGSLIVFYYTELFSLAMFTHTGHVLMTAHFLLTGYLFVWALVGIDPGPQRPPYPFRLVLLFMVLAFHAFFGITLMSSGTLLAPDWWHALGQTDDQRLLADQQTGGGIAWATGDLPALLLAVALIIGWVRSDAQEGRRLDRQADRDDDAELRRYNEKLAAMSRRPPRG